MRVLIALLPVALFAAGTDIRLAEAEKKADKAAVRELLLTLLDRVGVRLDSFANSNGKVAEI